jgi:ArsR family transcriptional regulator, arsenate/arsenite/antimonite-responsive transcriptional repressor / arsenate reductase (thioredoxin)
MTDVSLHLEDRAALYRALGDERRLAIVDALRHTDRPVGALGELTGLPTNLLAFHLGVLEEAGAISRTVSQGDARRRYVTLDPRLLPLLGDPPPLDPPFDARVDRVLFICTANSARSQLAAHLWRARTGAPALSAGTEPADQVHPGAVAVARRHGLDLAGARPVHVREVGAPPELVVSVCDRAHETELDLEVPMLHWSIPDPVDRDTAAFERAYGALRARIDLLARAAGAA